MKKFVAFLLAAAMCLSLCACSSGGYEDIIKCLDDKDYSGAIALIQKMAEEENDGQNIDGMDDNFSGDNGGDADAEDPEKEALYNKCISFLNDWAEHGDATFQVEEEVLSGHQAFLNMYDNLQPQSYIL